MQIMYGLMGERRLTEWEADWLPGYLDSKPVRIGNAAHRQFQLDVYGELMDTFEQARKGGPWRPKRAAGRSSANWSIMSRRPGANPTTASGKRAARPATSPIPR